ncbi:glycosyltransferase [Campylobacter sp.]|uniref:glycosyltransferase n=1 Tax=Campylobacter sp. TaxID=205 RepID=UPI002A54AEB6|nr:glycosyltransferase [Campylobacter sp.]MDD7090887.1 glycosyltransferase [Campylobacteraceae bacterium]MDY5285191.1 glycosyltransferase [Campylobacter sp.]
MKLLFVITSLENGGAERVCASLANYFSTKHEVEILYFSGEIFYEISPKVKLNKFTRNSRIPRLAAKLLAIRKHAKDADCILSFMDSTNILSIIATAFLGRKLIISEHSAHDFVGLKWRVLRRIFYPFATTLTVLNKSDFSYYSFVKNKAIIYNPSIFKTSFGEQKEKLIIFVGRLEPVKGCDIFLRALALLKLYDFKLLVLGAGSQKKSLQSLSAKLGLKNLEFLGSVSDIQNYYKKAKIIVSSSRFEGLGNVLIESAFFECIRVATPTAGALELLEDGKNGFISSDFSEQALAKAILKAINADESVLENTRAESEKFSLENIAAQWWELIK